MNFEQIEKLNELKEKGMITEEEYQQAKAKILGSQQSATDSQTAHGARPMEIKTNNYDYAMVMHLSLFISCVIPLVGFIVALVMWQTRKEDPYIDQQGKVIMNWVASLLIYTVISWVLVFILIGFVLLFALMVFFVVFTIINALNANKGIVKNYPLTIKFFDVQETAQV